MPRIIEIVLFLAPFVAFFLWRRFFRVLAVPVWLLVGLAAFELAMLGALLWSHQQVAGDAHERYAPATYQDGRIIPGGPARSP